jgi:hypothetical protein
MTLPKVKAIWTVAALAALLAFGTSAGAQTVTPSRCAGRKTRCVAGRIHVCGPAGVRGRLKCHQRADLKSLPVDPACLQLAVDEMQGCFRNAERRKDCGLKIGDRTAHQDRIDAFVEEIVKDLDPQYPATITNLCLVGKLNALASAAGDKLTCFAVAFQSEGTVDQFRLRRAKERLAQRWTKLEAHGDCLTTGDLAALEAKIDQFVQDTVAALDPGAP